MKVKKMGTDLCFGNTEESPLHFPRLQPSNLTWPSQLKSMPGLYLSNLAMQSHFYAATRYILIKALH